MTEVLDRSMPGNDGADEEGPGFDILADAAAAVPETDTPDADQQAELALIVRSLNRAMQDPFPYMGRDTATPHQSYSVGAAIVDARALDY